MWFVKWNIMVNIFVQPPMVSAGAFALGLSIIALAHWVLRKPQVFEPYCVIMTIAVISRAIGNYKFLVRQLFSIP